MSSATDNRTTELREKLRELGIEFATDDFGDLLTTIWWVDGIFAKYIDWCEDEDVPTLKIRMKRITPEQAIAATLGSGTCELKHASWDDGQCTWGCICSACDAHFEHETGIGYNYCPNCGANVIQGVDNAD